MTKPAREAIEKAGTEAFAAFLDEYRIRAQNPGAGPASTRDWLEEACGRYRETFLSALTAADYVIERGWQPIETAPTMEAIQVIGGEVTYPVTASWTGRDDEPWCLDALGNVGQEIDPPTHWRPLPEPPAAAEAEAKGGDDAG